MNKKDKLYYDLIEAYRKHSCNDTLIDTYVNKVLKLVKDYLDFENLRKENQDLKLFVESYSNARDELLIKNEKLEKENQELKEENEKVCEINRDFYEEIEKLKKAIAILKENVLFEFFEPQSEQELHDCLNCGEEPYLIRLGEEWFALEDYEKFNLLKEVLGE